MKAKYRQRESIPQLQVWLPVRVVSVYLVVIIVNSTPRHQNIVQVQASQPGCKTEQVQAAHFNEHLGVIISIMSR